MGTPDGWPRWLAHLAVAEGLSRPLAGCQLPQRHAAAALPAERLKSRRRPPLAPGFESD
jgi:hypothetical protein